MEQISQVSLRPSRRGGFTLVELLVVIGIIGMLIALLLPAVMSAQEQARQTQCAKQMKDLAGAHLMHAMKKGRFAGWNSKSGDPWVVQIMPYLDMQQRSRSWKDATTPLNSAALQLSEYGLIEILFCPSNPPDDPKTSSQTGYAVNAGGEDPSGQPEPDSTNPNTSETSNRWTAPFHNRSASPVVSIGLDDVLDGKRQTLLLSENASLGNWDTQGEINQGIIFGASGNTLNNPAGTDDAEGRPSSFHQEGFNAAYCDGSVDFYFVDQDDTMADENSRLYHNMMTPAGAYNGIDPGSTP